jgi:hypothetical protein
MAEMASDPESQIVEQVKVTRQKIIVAKAFLRRYSLLPLEFPRSHQPSGTTEV